MNRVIRKDAMSGAIAIKTENLNKEFVRNKKVICDINLSIKEGELFCLVGANGAGKTTLIKLLCNLILPTSGSIFVDGYDMVRDSEKGKGSIGLVTGDERSFYWRLTGRQNMEFFAALYNLPAPSAKQKIEELFDILQISEPDKRFQEYPSGIKQKLSIARALLGDPTVLFIDELTKNLDHSSAKELRRFIKEVLVGKQRKTVFFTTHQLFEVEELADRIAFMLKGRITAMGSFRDLKNLMGDQEGDIEKLYCFFISNHKS